MSGIKISLDAAMRARDVSSSPPDDVPLDRGEPDRTVPVGPTERDAAIAAADAPEADSPRRRPRARLRRGRLA